MPKSNRIVKIENRLIKIITPTKFKIGNRKTGKSANLMSNSALKSVLEDATRSKWHNNARAVLTLRAA